MPIYEFECVDCKSKDDKLLKVDERNNTFDCDVCKSKDTVKLTLQSPSFHLKGNGWFRDEKKRR